MSKLIPLITTVCAVTLSACATTPKSPNYYKAAYNSPSKAVPHMVKVRNNKHPYNLEWADGGIFNPIPSNLMDYAQASCKAANFTKAVGYNRNATNWDGNPLRGGGFLCAD